MSIYWHLYRVRIMVMLQYRVNFIISVLTTVLMQTAALSFFWVVFSHTEVIGSWTADNVLFLFGMTALAVAVSELLFNGMWELPHMVMQGEIDRVLLYPVQPLAWILLSAPELHAIGNLLAGAILIGVSFTSTPPPWEAYPLLPVWVASTTAIYTSALVMVASASVIVVGLANTAFFGVLQLLNAVRYPIHIYPTMLKLTLLTVLPLGVGTYLPARWLRGEESLLTVALVPLMVAGLFVLASIRTWTYAQRRYQSAGS